MKQSCQRTPPASPARLAYHSRQRVPHAASIGPMALPHELKGLDSFVLEKVLNDGTDGGSVNGMARQCQSCVYYFIPAPDCARLPQFSGT